MGINHETSGLEDLCSHNSLTDSLPDISLGGDILYLGKNDRTADDIGNNYPNSDMKVAEIDSDSSRDNESLDLIVCGDHFSSSFKPDDDLAMNRALRKLSSKLKNNGYIAFTLNNDYILLNKKNDRYKLINSHINELRPDNFYNTQNKNSLMNICYLLSGVFPNPDNFKQVSFGYCKSSPGELVGV
jgi:hypothetical protein